MKNIYLAVSLVLFVVPAALCQQSDAVLRRVMDQDAAARPVGGSLPTLSATEHLSRAEAYFANRLFPQAREHWQKVIENYPDDTGIPRALFGMGRSFMWEREYQKAVEWFNKLTKQFPYTKDGREGLAFTGASLVRLGKNLEAARTYEQYTVMFPQGERIESAHLNIIDAYREAGEYEEAEKWVASTTQRFKGTPTEVNALHARLRMEIHRGAWVDAAAAADELLSGKTFAKSMASADEVKYLKALALDRAGKTVEAVALRTTIPKGYGSYFGGLLVRDVETGVRKTVSRSAANAADYPIPYRAELLRHAGSRGIDPRFVLAIMKQESSFRPNAKSPAAARGLLQLVYDTAIKYNAAAGFPQLQPDDLYDPATNIAIGSVYIAELKKEFGGLYEAVAASYNGGEDNAARWLNRSNPKEPGVFASEVGFSETKNYVFKVMNNYRVYRDLYTEDLRRK